MKFLLFSAFLFISVSNSFSQQETYTLAAVDEAPFIRECYDPNKDSKECFNQNLSDYLQSNLVTPKTVKGEGKAYVTFLVTASGNIKNIKVRATDEDQSAEVVRVLSSLKLEKPATLNGEPVAVTHAMPVIFKQAMYNSYSSFFETRAKNLPHAAKTAFPPLFETCVPKNDKRNCFQETVEEMILKAVKASPGAVLNYYFEIGPNAETQNVLVLSHNAEETRKKATAFLERLALQAPARDEQKQPVKSYFYGNLVF